MNMVGVIVRSQKLPPQWIFRADGFIDLHYEPSWVRMETSRRRRGITGKEIERYIVEIAKSLIAR